MEKNYNADWTHPSKKEQSEEAGQHLSQVHLSFQPTVHTRVSNGNLRLNPATDATLIGVRQVSVEEYRAKVMWAVLSNSPDYHFHCSWAPICHIPTYPF